MLTKTLVFNKKYLQNIESSVNDSRKFWCEIKKVLSKPKSEADISLDKWFEHFSTLFSNDNTEEVRYENVDNNFDVNMHFDEIEQLYFQF